MAASTPSITAADLQRIGVSKPYAHQLASRARKPSLTMAVRIEDELGVPVRTWLAPTPKRGAKR